MGYARVRIYLPDDLYRPARARRLSLSALTRMRSNARCTDRQEWVDRVLSRPERCTTAVDVGAVLDDVRSEFGA